MHVLVFKVIALLGINRFAARNKTNERESPPEAV